MHLLSNTQLGVPEKSSSVLEETVAISKKKMEKINRAQLSEKPIIRKQNYSGNIKVLYKKRICLIPKANH